MSTKKTKINEEINMSITANGEDDVLNLMRKLAGISSSSPASAPSGPGITDIKDIPIDVVATAVDEDGGGEYINSPRPTDLSVIAPDKAPGSNPGNGGVTSVSNPANPGDNRMRPANPGIKVAEGADVSRCNKEGHAAKKAGKPRSANPYKEDSDGAKHWARGYDTASGGKEPEKYVENVRMTGKTIEEKLYGQFKSMLESVIAKENMESDQDEDEWYDKNGRPTPNGAYDAGGHYHLDRDVDEGIIDTAVGKVKGAINQHQANKKGWGEFGKAYRASRDGEDEKAVMQHIRNSNRYRNFANGGTGFKSTKESAVGEAAATAPATGMKLLAQLYKGGELSFADKVSKSSKMPGCVTFYRGFFYRNGGDEHKWADQVMKNLQALGINGKVVDTGEKYGSSFRGGASVKSQDHWWCTVQISDGATSPSEVVAEGADLESLRKQAREISDKIDTIVNDGGQVGLGDPLSVKLSNIRKKIAKAK